jgi:hypothetical protein
VEGKGAVVARCSGGRPAFAWCPRFASALWTLTWVEERSPRRLFLLPDLSLSIRIRSRRLRFLAMHSAARASAQKAGANLGHWQRAELKLGGRAKAPVPTCQETARAQAGGPSLVDETLLGVPRSLRFLQGAGGGWDHAAGGPMLILIRSQSFTRTSPASPYL